MHRLLSDKIASVLTVVAVLFLAGVVYVGATSPSTPPSTNYTLTMHPSEKDNTLRVQGDTNIPDSARLEVIVDRLYRLDDHGEWHAARVGQTHATVNGGQWEADVPLDDTTWVDDLAGRLRRREISPLHSVLPDLRITVLFSPLVHQPESVATELGANFERLAESNLAVEEGDHWVIRRQELFSKPLAAQEQNQLSPQALSRT